MILIYLILIKSDEYLTLVSVLLLMVRGDSQNEIWGSPQCTFDKHNTLQHDRRHSPVDKKLCQTASVHT